MSPSMSGVAEHLTEVDLRRQLADDATAGLTSEHKWIPATWFYDAVGSDLFDEITRLPEYYPTRTEASILAERADEIAAAAGAEVLVELGSGTSTKTALLIDALLRAGTLHRFVPFDVSGPTLRDAVARLSERHHGLAVSGVVGDFRTHLPELLHATAGDGPRLVIFLGGTIGNLNRLERAEFLGELAAGFTPGDRLLLGTDLVKDPARLVAAYDDAAGVTAAFNRNVLSVLNRELGADFAPERFDHVARWDSLEERIEMRLRSRGVQRVEVAELGLQVQFSDGEDLLTEISCKFRPDGVRAELASAGFELDRWFTDPNGDFALSLARVAG